MSDEQALVARIAALERALCVLQKDRGAQKDSAAALERELTRDIR